MGLQEGAVTARVEQGAVQGHVHPGKLQFRKLTFLYNLTKKPLSMKTLKCIFFFELKLQVGCLLEELINSMTECWNILFHRWKIQSEVYFECQGVQQR